MSRAKIIRDLYERGSDALSRFMEHSSVADLDTALECFRQLDGLVPASSWRRTPVQAQLGFCLASRYALSDADVDRDLAIEYLIPLIAKPDPDGALDSLRIVLGQLLASRAMTNPASDLRDLQAAADLLAIAETSPTIVAEQRAEALGQLARAKVMLTILRAWEAIARRTIPDIGELRMARQGLARADEHSPALSLALGLALGFRWHSSGSQEDLREAIEFLIDGLQDADRDAAWRDYSLKFLALLLSVGDRLRSETMPATRALNLAEKWLAAGVGNTEEEGIYHMIAFCAIKARPGRRNHTAGHRSALDHLNRARQLLSGEPELSNALLGLASGFLADRGQASGSLEDQDAAQALSQSIRQTPLWQRSLAEPDEPDVFGNRPAIASQEMGSLIFQADSPAESDLLTTLHDRIRMAEGVAESNPIYWPLNQLAAEAQAALGLLTNDPPLVDAALVRLRDLLPAAGLVPGGSLRAKTMLGRLTCERFLRTGDQLDLDNGIAALEAARDELGASATGLGAVSLFQLAESYRLRNDPGRDDPGRAVETGLLALSERTAEVLLQSDAERGLRAARDSALLVTRLVSWCLEDGRPAQAIQALEQGRALVLQATALAPDIPGLLRSADRGDLAESWTKAAGGPEIPADTRNEVLEVLRASWSGADLLTPLSVADLAAGVAAAGYDALVYLLPADTRLPGGRVRPGSAALVTAAGEIQMLSLPELTERPVAAYDQAHLATIEDPDDQEARQHWQEALGELCDWAWNAAVGPLLTHLAGWRLGRAPHLALVPTGKLGAVPWHAARTWLGAGPPHYALEDALICYAASARQLITASRRTRRQPAERPVLVSNPTGDLRLAVHEGRELRRQFYPHAVVFGALGDDPVAGPGTPQEILDWLPGGRADQASMLHFGCHATVGASLAESRLLLAGWQPLTIAEIAAQAQGRDPGAPGFLAILGACMTDLASTDHDEALTLASALLAAGASGVVGTRWPTSDLASAHLLVMFHHFLGEREELRPAEALRAAQLWMLNPSRRGLDGLLAPTLARTVTRPALAEIGAWAGFTYQGA
ncbi:MAG TPA: CHAT domain-containing protein [Streptosporangiaceae bacterium]|nr:CHAT domain-containing protein [Streptosporangiaceae bacterium]